MKCEFDSLFSFSFRYKLRIDALLLKEEFEATMEQIEPSVNAIIYTARDLLNNAKFHEVLYMVLVAGNFLNNVIHRVFF